MNTKYIQPNIGLTAFSCPHCSTLTSQFWHTAMGGNARREKWIPKFPDEDTLKALTGKKPETQHERSLQANNVDDCRKDILGEPFVAKQALSGNRIGNVMFSECYECHKLAIWLKKRLLWPNERAFPAGHPDLPEELLADYNEAGEIAALSPRGAAALLRLVVQKLCTVIGGTEDTIDKNIKKMVENGLPVRLTQLLDTVRVVGNEAVHPLTMDLKDDRETALVLFTIINRIVEEMITKPRELEALYNSLPRSKLDGIKVRDKAARAAQSDRDA